MNPLQHLPSGLYDRQAVHFLCSRTLIIKLIWIDFSIQGHRAKWLLYAARDLTLPNQ